MTTFAYDAEHRGRAFNVELAAQAVDGRVIRAGGTLSFNEAVGERTASFGFARSVVLRDGMLAEGAGGGACQVASTLHAAALLAGLDVVSRAPHSRPSAYIRMGFDATVALGPAPIDLRLKNPTAAPVVVHARAHRGALDVWLEGRGPAPEVRLTSEIVGRVGYPRTIARDPLVPEDVVKIRSFGIPGYRVRRVRELRLPDGTTRRDVREDVYPPVPEVVVVAAGYRSGLEPLVGHLGVLRGDGRPVVRGAKPSDCSTWSARSTCAAPPAAGLTVTFTPSASSSMLSTLVLVSTVTPSFL